MKKIELQSGAMPPFLVDRHRQVVAAGAAIARADVSGDRATHWYEGTKEQLIAAGFAPRTARVTWPTKGRRLSFCDLTTPCASRSCDAVFLGSERYRIVASNEPMPLRWDEVRAGVMRYECISEQSGSIEILVGDAKTIIAHGLADEQIATEDRGWLPGRQWCGLDALRWSAFTLPDGRRVVERYLNAEAREERRVREVNRLEVRSLDEFRRLLVDRADSLIAISAQTEVESKDGSRYYVDSDSLDEIACAASRLQQAIETATLRVDRPARTAPTAQQMVAASGDTALQRFLNGLR